ncbi:MAG: serine/threonine-protein kinase, partial [Acidimicrobiales bacterium]
LGDRYQLRGLLGRGGMGDVRDGWDTRLDRPVAIKVLRPDLATQSDLRRRFEAEAKAAATLNHPHVVAVFDSGEDAGVPYIVMERLPGRTLADEIAGSPLAEDQVRKILVGVTEALVVAHDAGILHRDIKPGNVLFSADGTVKVADFGIAKSTDTDHTMTGQILGTAAYLSPERLSGKPSTVVDDLYAVGVVGYEALCGRKPFAGDSPIALVRAISDGHVLPLATERPGVDPALAAVIEQAMARDPERRFISARSMLRALRVDASVATTETVVPSYPTPSTLTQVLTIPHASSDTQVLTSPVLMGDRAQSGAVERMKARLSGMGSTAKVAAFVVLFVMFLVILLSLFAGSSGHGNSPPPSSSVPTTGTTSGSGSLPPALVRALNHLSQSVQP